jgi:hypothetical protein
MNNPRRVSQVLLSCAAVLLVACSSSKSGGQQGGVGDGSTTFGGDGAAGSGPPSGTAAGDAGVPSGGGTGGAYGGGAGAGGTPSPCPDPNFPVSCPGLGDVPALCWSAGTACSSVAHCGNDFRSCTSASAHFDCAQMTCVSGSTADGGVECGDPAFPVSCPAVGDVPKLCWSAGTICSTIGRCGNDFKSCLMSGYHYSCATQACVLDTSTDAGVAAPDAALPDAATSDAAADASADALADAHAVD